MKFLLALFLALALTAPAQRQPGSQLDHLPANMEVLTHFGERADISPDNQRVAFMAKSFGDAMVVDLKIARRSAASPAACPGAAFLRVMHLDNGRLHPDRPRSLREHQRQPHARQRAVVPRQGRPASKPVKFNEKMSEGMAISKTSHEGRLLADARAGARRPGRRLAAGRRRRDSDGGTPALDNKKVVYESKDRQLHDRSAGLLRQRHEDDVHVLRAEQRWRP